MNLQLHSSAPDKQEPNVLSEDFLWKLVELTGEAMNVNRLSDFLKHRGDFLCTIILYTSFFDWFNTIDITYVNENEWSLHRYLMTSCKLLTGKRNHAHSGLIKEDYFPHSLGNRG